MNAIILSVGDELVSGLTLNTNEAFLAQQLSALGIPILYLATLPDSLQPIAQALREAAAHADLVLVSGGLGPTTDDVTRDALAAALGEPLVEDAAARAALEAYFHSRQRPLSPSNLRQARRPASASCIPNSCGTAPGLAARLGNARIFITPGVPREMHEMFRLSILPLLQTSAGDRVTLNWKIHTFGRGESLVGEQIQDLMARPAAGGGATVGSTFLSINGGGGVGSASGSTELAEVCRSSQGGVNTGRNDEPPTPAVSVGTTVADGIVSVRIYSTGPRTAAQAALESTRQTILTRLGPLVFGENDQTLPGIIAALLRQRRQTIVTAESCTGGTLAQMLTDIPGSSAYFLRGWVTYSNQSKTDELGVPLDLIAAHGAVSEQVARAMAEGARQVAGASGIAWAIATTGIAGPDGGTPEKPVGTVWIAIAPPAGDTFTYRYFFPATRLQIRQRSSQMALTLLRFLLLGLNPQDILR